MKTKIILIILISIVFTACTNNRTNSVKATESTGAYEIVYQADKEGKAVSGSLEKLVEYVNNGNPVRVGWAIGLQDPKTKKPIDMIHWSDGGFVTVIKGHVFAQVKPINQQGPAISDPPGIFLVEFATDSWVAVIGTTGAMNQKYKIDGKLIEMMKKIFPDKEKRKEEMRKMENMKVATKWAVLKK